MRVEARQHCIGQEGDLGVAIPIIVSTACLATEIRRLVTFVYPALVLGVLV